MSDTNIKVLTPATTFDLLTLDEYKLASNISPNDNSQDARIAQLITRFSDVVAVSCNRVFGRETVQETWRDLESRRVYLSHWPAKREDITAIECPRGTLITDDGWEFEEWSGKVELFSSQTEPIVVTYTGGYNLPDDAPPALKQATELLIREGQAMAARMETSGIRSISHKEARVMFFDPMAASRGKAPGGAGGSPAMIAAHNLLMRYTRFPC